MKKQSPVRIPLGGISIGFDGPIEALESALSLGLLEAKCLGAVQNGELLRLDAVRGETLIGTGVIFDGPGEVIPEGWYGTIHAVGVAVGPFKRKSQAMNAIVLALMGMRVEADDPVEETPKDELVATIVGSGVEEETARHIAADLRSKFGDDVAVKVPRGVKLN